MAPITDCMKKGEFQWPSSMIKAFKEIKENMAMAAVLRHLDFSKVFKVICNASDIGIGGVPRQEDQQAFFSEKLNEAKQNYSSYDKEFYVIVQSIRHWRYYLLPQEFVLYSNHQALTYLWSQKKLNSKHILSWLSSFVSTLLSLGTVLELITK